MCSGDGSLYNLDLARLEKSFRDLQWRLHPDKFSMKPEAEQNYSAGQSSLVNKAYQTLKDPLARGQYLVRVTVAGFRLVRQLRCFLSLPPLVVVRIA